MKKSTFFFICSSIICSSVFSQSSYKKQLDNTVEKLAEDLSYFQQKIKSKQTAKTLRFYEAYTSLEYDTTNLRWDSISRTTQEYDSIVNSPNLSRISNSSDRYNGVFWINSDSTYATFNTSVNAYKYPTNVGLFDTLKTFSWDSATSVWIPFLRNHITLNANNDIVSLESFLNFAAFGLPGMGFQPLSRIDFNYDSGNNLIYWIEKEMSFGVGLVNADSVIVTNNASGYRTLDDAYEWNGSSWDPDSKTFYTYGANNELNEEITQYYDQSNSTYINSNRNYMLYNANLDEIADTSYNYNNGWEKQSFDLTSYTSFNLKSVEQNHYINNGVTFIEEQETHYYNSSNTRDSSIKLSTYGLSSSSPLRNYEKSIYQSTPFSNTNPTNLAPAAPTNLILTAGSKSIPTMDLQWQDNSSNELGFGIERSLDSTNWTSIDSTGVNENNYLDTTIASNTKYYYRVFAYNANGASATSNAASLKSLTVGISTIEKINFTVSPNPFMDRIKIESNNKTQQIDLLDIKGRIIHSYSINQSRYIDLSHLSQGMYFLRNSTSIERIIKL